MLKHLIRLGCFMASAIAWAPLWAATYYVALDGSDKNPGTNESPWATLRQASQRARPGDVVKVRPGVYRGPNVITGCHGTPEAPITFQSDGGQVVFDASQPLAGWKHEGGSRHSVEVGKTAGHLIWANDRLLLGPNYRVPFDKFAAAKDTLNRGQCVLHGGRLYVRLFDSSDPNQAQMRISTGHCLLLQSVEHTIWRGMNTAWGLNGYKLEAGSRHNVVEDAEIHHHGQGILEIGESQGRAACEDNTFRRLEIHHVGLTKFEHGIYTNGIRTRILGCRFHHISGAAIHAYSKPLEGLYDGNVMTDPLLTYAPSHFQGDNPPDPTGHYTAFVLWGRGKHRVTNNLIAGPFTTGISVRSDGNLIANNTIALADGQGLSIQGERTGLVIRNNIISTKGPYVAGGHVDELDYNGYFAGQGWSLDGASFDALPGLRKQGRELHGLLADPRFVNPSGGDYHLSKDSPMRDAGAAAGAPDHDLSGAPRPQGPGVDLGAYEGPAGK